MWCFGGFACGCARNRRQETNVLISVLFAVVVNLALRSNAQGRIEVVGMRKLTIDLFRLRKTVFDKNVFINPSGLRVLVKKFKGGVF